MGRSWSAGLAFVSCFGVLAASAQPAGAEDVPAPAAPQVLREIRLRVACDEEWRAQEDWERLALSRVAGASAVFENGFGIRWTVVDVVRWSSDDTADSLGDLLSQVERVVPRTGVDVVLGFTDQTHARGKDGAYRLIGAARYYGPSLIIGSPRYGEESTRTGCLTHELGHVLGAWHCAEWDSVMQHSGDRGSPELFDARSAAAIELARDLDFAKGVDWFDEERRRKLDAVFREGHLPGDLVPYVDAELRRAWKLMAADPVAGLAAYRRALAAQESCAGPHDLGNLWCLYGLARAELRSGRIAEAERLAVRALTYDAGANSPETTLPEPETLIADVRWAQGRRDEALVHYAAACESLAKRRPADDRDLVDAASRLRQRKIESFDLDGRAAWEGMPWRVLSPLPAPATRAKFETPAPSNLHVRRARATGERSGAAVDPMSETFTIAVPVPGELTLEFRPVLARGVSGEATRVSARIPAATASAASAVAEVVFLPSSEPRVPRYVGYSGILTLRPAGADEDAAKTFRAMAPGRATYCIDRAPISSDAGFVRLPFGTTLYRCRQWVGTTENPQVRFVSDDEATVDGVRVTPDGAGALHTWRIELTFVPDGAK